MVLFGHEREERGDGGRRGDDRPRGRPPQTSAERHARILAYTGEDQGSGDQSGGCGCGCLVMAILFAIIWIIIDVVIF